MVELLESAIISAVISVGLTQIMKQWLPETIKTKWYSLIFTGITFVLSSCFNYIPEAITNALLAVSVGNLGYDNIIKVVQKALQKIVDNGGANESE